MPRRGREPANCWSWPDLTQSPSLLVTLVGFLLLLGPLIVVHELGHYLVGRWCGVKADAFSVGFGKELFGFTDRRGTRWKLSAIPLGGYVQFAGDMDPTSRPDDAKFAGLTPEEKAQTIAPTLPEVFPATAPVSIVAAPVSLQTIANAYGD